MRTVVRVALSLIAFASNSILCRLALAAASSALASGVGYSIWYAALPRLSAIRAGIVRLVVPILAAFGGVVMLGETVSARLVFAGAPNYAAVAVAVSSRP